MAGGADSSPVQVAEQLLRDALPALVERAISLARGGNYKMLVYCIDRVLGSPVKTIALQDEARRIATERGLDPDRVVNLFETLKRRAS
jgi:hypothetical protein